jgi:protoheme IX farnesyltransferase
VKEIQNNTQLHVTAGTIQVSWWKDIALLIKLRLTMMVVFSAVMGYTIAAGGAVQILPVLILALGGLCVTGAANAINQILEKEYDALMIRTANRPVAAGRMQVSEAVVIAGLMLMAGIVLLSLFNPLSGFLGMLSFVLYAFLYTPMKRYGTLSVAIGAIPGALPVLIGYVAFQGTIGYAAMLLFAVQFLWQFPHFWSIGFLSFDQYQKAGFKLVPSSAEGSIHSRLGANTVAYALLLIPVCIGMVWLGVVGIYTGVLLAVVTLWYVQRAFVFWRKFDTASARSLMFTSFAYLPLVLLIILIGGLA